MSKLFNGPLLSVNTALAVKIGLNESIVLSKVHCLLKKKRKLKDKQTFQEGHYWVCNSYDSWQKQFPFWSKMTIRRIFKKLIENNLLVVDSFNDKSIDRTNWYRVNYKTLESLGIQI